MTQLVQVAVFFSGPKSVREPDLTCDDFRLTKQGNPRGIATFTRNGRALNPEAISPALHLVRDANSGRLGSIDVPLKTH